MQNIYCGNGDTNGGQGHFLARLNGADLEIWCAKCKAFHAVAVVDLVRGTIAGLQNGHDPEKEKRLLW